MNNDLSKSSAARHRLCCVCGKYCKSSEYYFPKIVSCLNCYRLQDLIDMRCPPYFIIPYEVKKEISR